MKKSTITRNYFTVEQIAEIKAGRITGLSRQERLFYADPKFGPLQMSEIRRGLKQLPMDKVKIYAKPEFISWQMCEIKVALIHGLSEEEIAPFAKPELSWVQIRVFRDALEYFKQRLSNDNMLLMVKHLAKYAIPQFDCWQLKEIVSGYISDLDDSDIAEYAIPSLKFQEMRKRRIEIAKKRNKFPIEYYYV